MNQLYPIIRRKRRPLLPVEDPPNEGGSKDRSAAVVEDPAAAHDSTLAAGPADTAALHPRTDRRAVRAALGGKADETSAVRTARLAIAPHH